MKIFKILFTISLWIPFLALSQEVEIIKSTNGVFVGIREDKLDLKNKLSEYKDELIVNDNIIQKSKTFSKTFTIGKDEKVNVENKYGSIVIKTWAKNEFKVDIDIRAYSNSEQDAQKLVESIDIESNKNNNAISVKTIIAKKSGNFSSTIKNGVVKRRREILVNYIIYMPMNNPLNLNQTYGNIVLDTYNGPTAIKLQYGNLKANALTNSNNYINLQYAKCEISKVNAANIIHSYGNGLTINSIGVLDLAARYVNVNIGIIEKDARINQEYGNSLSLSQVLGNLNINSRYANLKIGNVSGNTDIKSDYGSVTTNTLNNLSLISRYTNVKIEELNGNGNIKMNYNSLTINNITPLCKNLKFFGQYTHVNFGFNNHFGGEFSLDTSYSNFKHSDNITSSVLNSSHSSKSYNGKIGSGGQNTITLKSSYGNINFK